MLVKYRPNGKGIKKMEGSLNRTEDRMTGEGRENYRISVRAAKEKKGTKGIWLIAVGMVLLLLALIGVINAGMLNQQLGEMGMSHLSIDEAISLMNNVARYSGQSISESLNGTNAFVLFTVTKRVLLGILGAVSVVGGLVMKKKAI